MRPVLLPLLLAATLPAQDTTPASALQRVQQLFSSQNAVTWVQTPTNPPRPADATHVTASLTDVQIDPAACTLTFKDGRNFPDQKYEAIQTWKINLKDIDRIQVDSLEAFVERSRSEGGQPRWDTKTSPAVYVLQMVAAPGRKFNVHRWSRNSNNEIIERDLNQPLAFVVFASESGARESATAMQKAKDLCKQPAQ